MCCVEVVNAADQATDSGPGHGQRTRPRTADQATDSGPGHGQRTRPHTADHATDSGPGHGQLTSHIATYIVHTISSKCIAYTNLKCQFLERLCLSGQTVRVLLVCDTNKSTQIGILRYRDTSVVVGRVGLTGRGRSAVPRKPER